MHPTRISSYAIVRFALLSANCGKSKPPLVVGSKDTTEQVLLGEIVAQHLEHRLGRKVERRLGLGGTLIAYQALLNGEFSLYPEYTGAVEAEILKERASEDPAQVFERVKSEVQRLARAEVLDPLGVDN